MQKIKSPHARTPEISRGRGYHLRDSRAIYATAHTRTRAHTRDPHTGAHARDKRVLRPKCAVYPSPNVVTPVAGDIDVLGVHARPIDDSTAGAMDGVVRTVVGVSNNEHDPTPYS